MPTQLNKRVVRRSNATVRDGGKTRRIVVAIYPNDIIGLRPEKTRREEFISIEGAWNTAVKNRVAREQAEKAKQRKTKLLVRRGNKGGGR